MAYKLFGIEWVPLNEPLSKRIQTLALAFSLFVIMFFPMYIFVSFYILFYTKYWILILIYCIWMYYDRDIFKKGGRSIFWVKTWTFWKFLRDYFPVTLEKTVELDPNRRYLFCCHPHGVLPFGTCLNFATEANDFTKLFPGLTVHFATKPVNTWIPFRREIVLSFGIIDSCRKSLNYLLNDEPQNKGNVAALFVGGIEELYETENGLYKVYLRDRKGFAKTALQNGADLVPVFCFGEIEAYNIPTNETCKKIKQFCKEKLNFRPPMFYGRGILNYTVGLLPHSTPIHTVVGKPIEVDKSVTPTEEQINLLHSKYTEALTELFDTHKGKYDIGIDTKLCIY